ncbi:MAG: hypothetical protein WCD87_17750, partial [Pseudolabrys sp.]
MSNRRRFGFGLFALQGDSAALPRRDAPSPFRAAQHGQRESVVARAATNLRRIVAIEFGTW